MLRTQKMVDKETKEKLMTLARAEGVSMAKKAKKVKGTKTTDYTAEEGSNKIYVDSDFLIALNKSNDFLHEKAVNYTKKILTENLSGVIGVNVIVIALVLQL